MTITINVKYFGMIAETIGKSSEQLKIEVIDDVNLKIFSENKYPQLKKMDYKIAINQQLTDILNEVLNNVEVALLPPFAGG